MAKKFWPLGDGRIVTSPFGQRAGGFHTGVDFGRNGGSAGMRVYAIQSGTVIYTGAADGYGGPDPCGWIVVDSDDSQGGGCWEYGHIVRLPHIKPGVVVEAGQQIATVNPDSNTNGGTAPHLHVSFMPFGYDPSNKIGPMSQLGGALEPEFISKDVTVTAPRPDFNEYPMWSPSHSSRNGVKVDLFLLHTQEGDANADGLARWLQNPANQVSYHYTISEDYRDHGVTVCDVVDTDKAAWAALSANYRAIHLVFAGSKASWTREQWMKQSRAIDVAAYLAVQDSKKYKFTPRVMAPPYNSNPPGISDHNYVTKWLKDGTHTDVGPNFPWDFFTAAVNKYANPQPATPKPPAVSSSDEMIRAVWEQLVGPEGKGWPQLGGRTLVDAIAELTKGLPQ